jgi:release factor glutamine methyltransferase
MESHMDLQEAQRGLSVRLNGLYEEREAAAISDLVMEKITGWKKIDRLLNKHHPLEPGQVAVLQHYQAELERHRPVQYVLEEAWFCGMKFYVDENVLIPRPETEELVEWVASEFLKPIPARDGPQSIGLHSSFSLLDVGTGSGCIAIALQKKLSTLPAPPSIFACDISQDALAIARRNASEQQAPVNFFELDFLDPAQRAGMPLVDCIVSNPPYIPAREKDSLAPHVVEFEPARALFVPDDDALIFYKALALFARERSSSSRFQASPLTIYAEIHENLAGPVVALFQDFGFQSVILRKDLHGKERMVKATL